MIRAIENNRAGARDLGKVGNRGRTVLNKGKISDGLLNWPLKSKSADLQCLLISG